MVITRSAKPAPGLSETELGYYGWRVALAACLGVMVGFGSLFVYTFGVFVRPLSAQFGWSREGISRGFGLAALSVAFCSPTIGHWLDRYCPRRVITRWLERPRQDSCGFAVGPLFRGARCPRGFSGYRYGYFPSRPSR